MCSAHQLHQMEAPVKKNLHKYKINVTRDRKRNQHPNKRYTVCTRAKPQQLHCLSNHHCSNGGLVLYSPYTTLTAMLCLSSFLRHFLLGSTCATHTDKQATTTLLPSICFASFKYKPLAWSQCCALEQPFRQKVSRRVTLLPSETLQRQLIDSSYLGQILEQVSTTCSYQRRQPQISGLGIRNTPIFNSYKFLPPFQDTLSHHLQEKKDSGIQDRISK